MTAPGNSVDPLPQRQLPEAGDVPVIEQSIQYRNGFFAAVAALEALEDDQSHVSAGYLRAAWETIEWANRQP